MKVTIETADGQFFAMHERVLRVQRQPWSVPNAGIMPCFVVTHKNTDRVSVYPCATYRLSKSEEE